jgi:RNAse (barnase) inhibitor barstar
MTKHGAEAMRIIDLNASGWRTAGDFYDALLPKLGAPEWHGRNANALNDSVIWGGINSVNPPLVIRVRGLEHVPKAVADAVKLAKRGLDEGREDFRAQHGRDIDVQFETLP